MLPFYIVNNIPLLKNKLRSMYLQRAYQIVPKILPFIEKGEILDIGCGTGIISQVIEQKQSSQITLTDVDFNQICDCYPVVIYDGKKLPFKNNQFGNSLLIAVLHHTQNYNQVLEEAKRVTKGNIIIMEDVFTDFLGRVITFIGDCLVNFEIHSPFKNHDTSQWVKIFKSHKLQVLHLEEFRLWCVGFPFKLAIFVLKK